MSDAVRFLWRAFDTLSARELHDLLRLRQAVFVLEQQCLFPDIDGKDPAAFHLLALRREAELVGTLRLFPPANGDVVIGRVATAAAVRGTGLGRALMTEAIAEARRRFGPLPIAIGAQARLERFYESFGFRRSSADYEEDGIAHCAMRLG